MKYLAKYENEPLSLYGFAVIDEWKKDEMQVLGAAHVTFIELSDLEVVVLKSLFNKGRFGEDFLRENCDQEARHKIFESFSEKYT